MKTLIFFLLLSLSGNLLSQPPGKDTTKVLQTDIYSNFKTAPQSSSYMGTIGLDSADQKKFEKTITGNTRDYGKTTQKADALFKKEDLLTAALLYTQAFKENNDQGKVVHRYKTACCFAMTNNIDSAFLQLYRIAEKGNYYDYKEIEAEKFLKVLHDDKRWAPLIEIIKNNSKKIEDKLNKETEKNNNR